jgi:AraC-like DNA-binding protein
MLASFKNMPYTKFDEANKRILTNNIFTDGIMYYREVEEGLWIMITEIEFKRRVSTHALYDHEPCDYYFMSYFKYYHKLKTTRMNEIQVPNIGWGLYKPGTQVNSYFAENDRGVFMDICFSKAWFEKNIGMHNLVNGNGLKEYLESDTAYKIWKDSIKGGEERMMKILADLKAPQEDGMDALAMKVLCLDLMTRFFQSIANMPVAAVEDNVSETDRRHLAIVERAILDALTTTFPGLENLATTANMSASKLKVLFKKVYGNSLFKYYQEKQMILALELLKESNSIKEVSQTLGYDNPSNFTFAFKKYYQFLPSEVDTNYPLVN